MKVILALISLLAIQATTVPAQRGVYYDHVFDQNIKTIQLYPNEPTSYPEYLPSILNISSNTPLVLKFDELYYDYTEYTLKLIHCNNDWRQSNLTDIEILSEYNDFPITNFEYSQNTLVPFTHYSIDIPRTKVTGNFIAFVFRKGQSAEPVFTKRFVVYENLVNVEIPGGLLNAIQNRNENHQIAFNVNYGNLETFNPIEDFKIVLRQNQRWDNAIVGLKPSMIKDFNKVLEFQHFNNENAFLASNEFRFFDLRFLTTTGQNIARIIKQSDQYKALVFEDQSRLGQVYSIYNDQNGLFFIGSLEAGVQNHLSADYVSVEFTLNHALQKEKIYVIGSYNGWAQTNENLLVYDKKSSKYTCQLKLKQGVYDYMYWSDDTQSLPFEGSHFQTRNQYEIIIYYRAPGTLFDKAVGYHSFFTGVY